MAIEYPVDLPLPRENKKKTQTATYRNAQPLSGPAYSEKLSDDAPAFYDLTFTFRPADSLVFRAWIELNSIQDGVEFEMPLRNEGTNYGGNEKQTVQLVNGDIRNATNDGLGNYTYSATFRCRKEVTGLEDYYQIIVDGGSWLLDGASLIDIAINGLAPEA